MVQLRYRGQNFILVGGYKIVNGYNEIKDDDFYNLMNSPTFALRVKSKVFEVPKDFPLVAPKSVVAPKQSQVKSSDEVNDENDSSDDQKDEKTIGTRKALKMIRTSTDKAELKTLVDHEDEKVAEAAKVKLDLLTKE